MDPDAVELHVISVGKLKILGVPNCTGSEGIDASTGVKAIFSFGSSKSKTWAPLGHTMCGCPCMFILCSSQFPGVALSLFYSLSQQQVKGMIMKEI